VQIARFPHEIKQGSVGSAEKYILALGIPRDANTLERNQFLIFMEKKPAPKMDIFQQELGKSSKIKYSWGRQGQVGDWGNLVRDLKAPISPAQLLFQCGRLLLKKRRE